MRWQLILGGAALLGGCHRSASSSSSDPPRIAVASLVTCAARDGHAMCWGDRQLLGNGKNEVVHGAALPSPVTGIDDAVDVAVGVSHGCVLRRGGAVACWGAGSGDRFGVGPSPASERVRAPLPVQGIADAEQLVAGGGHTCARSRSGRVLCWGDNDHGETSQPITRGSAVVSAPTAVEGIDDAAGLTTAEHRTCARRKSGEIDCWGTSVSALFAPCAPAEGCSARARPDAEQSAIIEAGRKPTAVPELRGEATMTEPKVRIWDGSGERSVSLAELHRYFTAPAETWEACVLVVLFGDDPLVVHPIHEGQCPARDSSVDDPDTALENTRQFFLDAIKSHRSPRLVDERDAVVARTWDDGASSFWISSAFAWSPDDAFAIAARFGLDGTACAAIEGRALVWEDGWIAAGEGNSFDRAWGDIGGLTRLDDVEVDPHTADEFLVEDLPIDDARLQWEEGSIKPRSLERGPIRLGSGICLAVEPAALRAAAATGAWSALNDLSLHHDVWLDALLARPMAALRHLSANGALDRAKLERAVTAHPRLETLSLGLAGTEVLSLRSGSLKQLLVGMAWTAREMTSLLDRAELPRLEWFVLNSTACEGLDFSKLGPAVRVAIIDATPEAIRAAASVPLLWVRSIDEAHELEDIERALQTRPAGSRFVLPSPH